MLARMMPNASTPPPASPPPTPTVADRVRAARLSAGLSQFMLAARAGLSLQTVGLVERAGICTPATAAKLGAVLGLDPRELA